MELIAQVTQIQKGITKIMALVQIEQDDLTKAASAIETIAQGISNLPPGTLAPADETAINQAITDAQTALAGKQPPAPAPSA
jgi:hypothetical protein